MGWITVLEKDQIEIRYDDEKKNVILEVNSGGFSSKYVTLYMNEEEFQEVLLAFEKVNEKLFKKENG
ncbi:MAG: hypothetical protein N2484_10445 [Clostridia bacterium]|nr:hypothetical protein [Clostridia bacterium]